MITMSFHVKLDDIKVYRSIGDFHCRLCGEEKAGILSVKGWLLCDDCISKLKEDSYE